jgi:hypothetical protein
MKNFGKMIGSIWSVAELLRTCRWPSDQHLPPAGGGSEQEDYQTMM